MKTPKDVLLGVKELLSDPNKWTQGAAAVDNEGGSVYPTDRSACQFCLIGGVSRVLGQGPFSEKSTLHAEVCEVLRSACREIAGNAYLTRYNDSHTHAEVMGLLDKAIELA